MPSSAISSRLSDRLLAICIGALVMITVIYMYWTRDLTTENASACSSEVNSKYVQNSLKVSEQVYQASIEKRRALVGEKPEKVNPWMPHTYPYDYFLATFSCPFSFQRLGKLGDGGKWVCGMEILEKKLSCVVYSFGISGEISFEDEILERTRCELYGFDASVDGISVSKELENRVHFKKLWGGGEVSTTTTTIGEAMRLNGHSKIDLIKVDIEGSEFKMLRQVIEEFKGDLPFDQLLLEIHMPDFVSLYKFFEMMDEAGLRPVRNELNIAPFVQGIKNSALSEYTFLYKKHIC